MLNRKSKYFRMLYLILGVMIFLSSFLTQGSFVEASPEQIVFLKDVPIGSIVYDPTWMWEHRTRDGYIGTGETKPVEWLVVAKNHEGYPTDSVTLLTKELIAKYTFDSAGFNPWGGSGGGTSKQGVRKFLNGSSYKGGDRNLYEDTLYDSFSDYFKSQVMLTTLNMLANNGNKYKTEDKIFLPSENELGGSYTTSDGINWGYFSTESSRAAKIVGESWYYWTRSPASGNSGNIRSIYKDGSIYEHKVDGLSHLGVRPALNMKSDTLVKKVGDKRYEIGKNKIQMDEPETQLIKEDGEIFIQGSTLIVDNQEITITSTIAGVTKSIKIQGPVINKPWKIAWLGTELDEGFYYPPDLNVKGTGGFNQEIVRAPVNSGTKRMTIDKTPPKLKVELTSSR